MKKIFYASAMLFLAACSQQPRDKKTELADLQKQQADINSKITKLQAEVGTPDASKSTDVTVEEVKTRRIYQLCTDTGQGRCTGKRYSLSAGARNNYCH